MSKRSIDYVPDVDDEQLPAQADIADIEERRHLASSFIPDEVYSWRAWLDSSYHNHSQ